MMLRRAALPLAILAGLALCATPADRNFDVRIKRPGSTMFTSFRTATSALKAFFNPTGAGTYRFEARTRIVSSGKTSGWSPVLALTIS